MPLRRAVVLAGALLTAATQFLLARPAPAATRDIGAVVPFFKTEDLRGRSVSLGDLVAAKRVVVFFWDYLRATSTREMNALERLSAQYAKQGLEVLAVEGQGSSVEQVLERVEKLRAIGTAPRYTIVADPGGRIARQFGVGTTPQTFFVNGAGRTSWFLEGFRAEDEPLLEARLKEFLGITPPPEPPVARPAAPRKEPSSSEERGQAQPEPASVDPNQALLERYRYYGNYYLNRKDHAKAIDNFRKFLEIEPRDAGVLLKIGEAYAMGGAYDRARESWEAVQRLDPGNPEADANIRRLIRGEY